MCGVRHPLLVRSRRRPLPGGSHPFDCYVVLSGEFGIIDFSTDEPTYLIRLRGKISRVTSIVSLGDARPPPARLSQVEAIRISPDKVREMLVRQPTLGARYLASISTRRELLMATDFQGLSVYGAEDDKRTLETVRIPLSQRRAASLDEHRGGRKTPPRNTRKSLAMTSLR